MNSAADGAVYTIDDLGLDHATDDLAVSRLEDLYRRVRRDALATHRHDFYSIVWLTQGQGRLWIDLDSYPVTPSMMCFLSPGQIHAWDTDGSGAGFVLTFTSRFFSSCSDDTSAFIQVPFLQRAGDVPVLYADERQAKLFSQACMAMEREQLSALPGHDAALRSYIRIVLIEARRIREAHSGAMHFDEAGLPLARQFLQLVETHYLNTSSVADYAAMLHVSTNHLIETVKRSVGQPAGRIVRERLLLEAKRLLRYSSLPIGEIADHLHFDDPSYFSRFFRKHAGVSPTEFRDQP